MKPLNPSTSDLLTDNSGKKVNPINTNQADWQRKTVTKTSSESKHIPTTRNDSDYESLDSSLSSCSISSISDNEILLKSGSEESLEDSIFWDKNSSDILGKNASITKTLGYGASAIVDLVEQTDIYGKTQKFALKRPKKNHQEALINSLKREAEIMKKVGDHPNIVKCYGFHKVHNQSGLLFEYIDGQNLETLTITLIHQLKTGIITPNEFFNAYAHLQKQQLLALAHLEKQSIVHSDIKPFNCMFDKNTQSVLQMDFGQAAEAGDRSHFGSEDFAAPDTFQLLKDLNAHIPAKTASDTFSYGQMLYRVLKELETGTAASFCYDAELSTFSVSERHARALSISRAMQKYETIKPDGTYHKAIASDEKSLEQLRLRVASTTHPNIQDFSALSKAADALKNYIDPIVYLINDLLHPNPSLRALPSEILHHKWFEQCISSPEEAKKTQIFAANNKA